MIRSVLFLAVLPVSLVACFPKGVTDTGDSAAGHDTQADTDTDADADTDSDADADTDTDTDADSDTDTDTDTDSDTDADPGRAPTVGELVITEVMSNPHPTDDLVAEWFEIYNASADRIALDGLTISDLGTDSASLAGAGSVAPGAYFVVGRSTDTTVNGGAAVSFALPSDAVFSLANDDDEIVISDGATVIDQMAYLDGQPSAKGLSWSLDAGTLTATGNDDATHWCDGSTAYGSVGMMGTPGAANPACVVSSSVR